VHRCVKKILLGASFGLLLAGWEARSLAAGANDQEARNLRQQAIMNDYLAMQFDAAVEKLEKALDLCAADQCSPSLVARLHRDLGVVYVAGLEDIEEGKAEFISALNIDPSIVLDKDLTTDKVSAVFEEVKGVLAEDRAKKKKEDDQKRAITAPGDIIHVPPPESQVQTALPIYAELKEGITAQKLKVRFKTATGDWESVEMKKVGTGWGVQIPCKTIGASPRMVEYFIQAYSGEDVVASIGAQTVPLTVQTKTKLAGPPPSLPGQNPPGQCIDECPPGQPGCGAVKGAECMGDEDCSEGLVCTNRVCAPKLEPSQKLGRRSWLSLAFQQDLMYVGAEDLICSGNNQWNCYWANGTFYGGIPDEVAGNKIKSSGFIAATMRVLVGFDYLMSPNLSLGARVGFAFGGEPQNFMPAHVEARGAYWFIRRSLQPGFRPYLVAAGGLANVAGHIGVKVTQSVATCRTNGLCPGPGPVPPDQDDSFTQPMTLSAWRKSGPVFLGVGLGGLYEFSQNLGGYLELKGAYMLPSAAPTMAIQIGGSYGF
jgi:hypothetical protein